MKIYSELINTNLTIDEKCKYVKARCLISQLNNLSDKEKNEYDQLDLYNMYKESENTILKLNEKIEIGHF